jgi:hypothetical protein
LTKEESQCLTLNTLCNKHNARSIRADSTALAKKLPVHFEEITQRQQLNQQQLNQHKRVP